jgi:hypothetical protein
MLAINFNEYMTYNRFNSIIQLHAFKVSDGKRNETDPLYQIKGYIDSSNKI